MLGRRRDWSKGANKESEQQGACLVPVDCTVHLASSNGADFWSPATTEKNHPSFSSSKQ